MVRNLGFTKLEYIIHAEADKRALPGVIALSLPFLLRG
jgi:hypothetical protein